MARIAVAGMQHETNTFAPSKADYDAFVQGGGWPSIQHGDAIFEAINGANIPAQGAVAALHSAGHRLVPLTWCSASPSAHVTDDAFERIVGGICERLTAAGSVDGVYLDLHGAMVTESFDDGEGELLRRVRAVVGPRVPVVASLDLHANVSQQMVDASDALSIYRTYPHTDMAQTGTRAAHLLMRLLSTQQALHKTFHQFDYLTGIPSQSTFIEPARSLYALLEQLEEKAGSALSFAMGFPMADIADCGMSVLSYDADRRTGRQSIRVLVEAIEAAEQDFAMTLYSPDDAVSYAMAHGTPGKPVIIADTQDNPGAGGNGDTTGLLEAMLKRQANGAVLGLLIDPASAARAHEIGQGSNGHFDLGAISGLPGHKPVSGYFDVVRLGDGVFTCTGPMFHGFRMQLGPMALLRHNGVSIVLASKKCQAADQEMFRHLGVEPSQQRIVALKSSVHFRAAFQPIAREVIVATAPGPCLAHPADFSWTRLRTGMRLGPLGQAFGESESD
ncbi:MAG: M81 family metallopeptidase [Burkholderiaceae bacterium]